MKATINTSPLIFLAKLGMLDCLRIYENVYTTSIVIEEVEMGLRQGFEEAIMIRKLVEEGFLVVKEESQNTKIKGLSTFGLHTGELSMLKMAGDMKPDLVIVDDRVGIKAAKYLGFNVVSTPFLLLKNLEAGKISKQDFPETLEKLMGLGYFLSPGLYVKILKNAEDL